MAPGRAAAADSRPRPKRRPCASLTKAVMCRPTAGASSKLRKMARRKSLSKPSLTATLDSHDPGAAELKLPFLRRRSKVVEIVSTAGIVVALTETGVCACFDAVSGRRTCYLNVRPDEVLRSLFFNKAANSVMSVSVRRADNFASLHCRSTPVDSLARGKPAEGVPVFEKEDLSWPGYIEFDDVTDSALTYSASRREFKVWDQATLSCVARIDGEGVGDLKLGAGVALAVLTQEDTLSQPLRLTDLQSGRTLREWKHELPVPGAVLFVELLGHRLLLQAAGGPLQVVDLATDAVITVDAFQVPTAFMYLQASGVFLTFHGAWVRAWSPATGALVTEFEDHELREAGASPSNVGLSRRQDLLVSHCRTGQVHVSDVRTGKLLTSFRPCAEAEAEAGAEADVTALCYDEDSATVVTGDSNGVLRVWGRP